MFTCHGLPDCPWFVVDADDKRRACLSFISTSWRVPLRGDPHEPITCLLPSHRRVWERPPLTSQHQADAPPPPSQGTGSDGFRPAAPLAGTRASDDGQ